MDVTPADINKTGLACDNHKNRNRRGPLDHSNLSAPLKVNGGPRVATANRFHVTRQRAAALGGQIIGRNWPPLPL